MPTLSSNPINQITNTHPLIQTRVPYSPNNPWIYGTCFIFPPDNKMFLNGLLRMDSTNTVNFNTSGYDNGLPFGYQNLLGDFEGGNSLGLTASSNKYFSGRHDPRFLLKFKFTGASDYEFWIGFANNINLSDIYSGDPLGHSNLDPDFLHGIGLYVLVGNNFRILSNDGTETSSLTSSILTYDQNIHTLYLESDHANSRWGYSLDNTAITYVTSKIPDPNEGMKLEARMLNKANDSDEKRITIYDIEAWQRRFPVS